MAILRSFESVFGRALAVVSVAVNGTFKPSGQQNPTDGAAIGTFVVDAATGNANSPTTPMTVTAANGWARDYFEDVGFSLVTNARRVAALGNNPDVDTVSLATSEDVWTGGGVYPWMTGATALEIVSSSAADAAAGTGARTVTINGLDAAWAEVSQTVTLNGITPVAIPTSLYRINSALVVTAGTGKTNAGDITIRDSGGGTTRAILPLGYGMTRQSQYTVPAGYTLQIHSLLICINRPSTTRDVTVATFTQSSTGVYRLPLKISVDGNPYRHDGLPGILVSEKTDFGLRCTYASATNTDLTAAWLGVMKLNTAT